MSAYPHPIYDRVWLQHPTGQRVRTTTRYRFALVTLITQTDGPAPHVTRSSADLQKLTDLLPRYNQHRQPVIFDTYTQERVA